MKDLNFFSIYQGSQKEKRSIENYIYGAAGVLGAVIVVTLMINLVQIFMLNSSIKEYTEKYNAPDLQAQLREAEDLNGKIDILDKYQGELSDIASSVKKNDIVTDSLLNDISGAIPSEVSFKDFDIKGYDLTIKGTSHNRTAIGEFEHNLAQLSKLKSVHVNEIAKSNAVGEDYSFEMTCVIKEVE